MKKKVQVIMLPTNNIIENGKQIHLSTIRQQTLLIPTTSGEGRRLRELYKAVPQHFYICSTDEIKEGDWYIVRSENEKEHHIRQCKEVTSKYIADTETNSGVFKTFCRKVIASTDSLLKVEKCSSFIGKQQSIPSIPQQFILFFIEEYNKGNIIKEVDVEYENVLIEREVIKDFYIWKLKLNGNEIIIHKCEEDIESIFEKEPLKDELKFHSYVLGYKAASKKYEEKLYTKAEIDILLEKFTKDFWLYRGVQISSFHREKWLNKNL